MVDKPLEQLQDFILTRLMAPGTDPDYGELKNRKIMLTNQVAFILVGVLTIMEVVFIALGMYPHVQISALIPVVAVLAMYLNRRGGHVSARALISTAPSIIFLAMSIHTKVEGYGANLIFTVAPIFALAMFGIVPVITFGLSDRRRMLLCIAPTVLAILFFAELHRLFGVDVFAYQLGEATFVFKVLPLMMLLVFSDLTLSTELMTKRFETKIRTLLEETRTQNDQLSRQTALIEEKNEYITAGIVYASRIQEALLKVPDRLKQYCADAFVCWLPRDIVSGDFYWFTQQDKTLIVAAADCTGHGVPGAFMTILGHSALNEIIKTNGLTRPDAILERLDAFVKTSLEGSANTNDGMDIVLVTLRDYTPGQAAQAEFAGANNPLYIARGNEMITLKGSRRAIGGQNLRSKPAFECYETELQPGDMIYLSSDGFQDQFGGPNGRKYLKKRFRELLLTLSAQPADEQNTRLQSELREWRDIKPQTDDVLIVGLRI